MPEKSRHQPSPHGRKTAVFFQGGGALGAYGCGAWEVLARWLRRRGDPVVAFGGTSIGAINAAVVARHWHEPDRGAAALARLWRQQIATPSVPFLGLPLGESGWARTVHSWNGFLTALLTGTRGLCRPLYQHWNPLAGLQRLKLPLYDRTRLLRLLDDTVGSYESRPGAPLLAVGATHVLDGCLHLFDSDDAPIGSRQLAASSAIPLMFEPVEIEGSLYWDGELIHTSLLPAMSVRLRASGRLAADEPLRWVVIDQFPSPAAQLPVSEVEVSYRLVNLLLADKLKRPGVRGGGHGDGQGKGAARQHDWLRITRAALPHDGVSGQFDYSPRRVQVLIEEGRSAAREALRLHSDEVPALAVRRPPRASALNAPGQRALGAGHLGR